MLSADAYGQGEADSLARPRARRAWTASSYSLVGAIGHDFYEGERQARAASPLHRSLAAGPDGYAGYLRMAAERSLERIGPTRFDLLLLHNPDRTGYESEAVWDAMAQLREMAWRTRSALRPGPANGFTLDLVRCFERFGDRIDWAMVILNPLEPWPGELSLGAAEQQGVQVITRVVDYGGLFWDDLAPGAELPAGDHRAFRPAGWIEPRAGRSSSACGRSLSAPGSPRCSSPANGTSPTPPSSASSRL